MKGRAISFAEWKRQEPLVLSAELRGPRSARLRRRPRAPEKCAFLIWIARTQWEEDLRRGTLRKIGPRHWRMELTSLLPDDEV